MRHLIESMVTYTIRCLTHISLGKKTVWILREMTVMETLSSFPTNFTLSFSFSPCSSTQLALHSCRHDYTCCFNQRHASIQPWPKIIFTACTMIYDYCPLVILKQSLDTNRLFFLTLFLSTSHCLLSHHLHISFYICVGRRPAATLNLIITTVRKINFTRNSNGAGQSNVFHMQRYIYIYIHIHNQWTSKKCEPILLCIRF